MRSYAVLIPAYQAGSTVTAAIRSALAQTLPPAQIIVVDDGSTDNTAEVLDAFGEQILRIRHGVNKGLSAARNTALEAATTSHVALLDADDTWAPERLAGLDKAFANGPASAVIATSDAWVVWPDGRRERYYENITFPEADRQHVEILRSNFVFGSAVVSCAAIRGAGGFDTTHSHDTEYEAWVRLILGGGTAVFDPTPTATYMRTTTSLSVNPIPTLRMRSELLERVEATYDLTLEQRRTLRSALAEARRRLDVSAAFMALSRGDGQVGPACLAAASHASLAGAKRIAFAAAARAPRLASALWRGLPERLRPATARVLLTEDRGRG